MVKFAKAAILEELGAPLVIKEIELPELARGQVLVKIFFSGVCRSQLMEALGKRGTDPWLPHLLGHEGSGVVIGVGRDVTKVKSGDEVILGWIKSGGIDAPGAKYIFNCQIINSGPVTTLSNYAIVSENRLVVKPSALPLDTAVLFGCALPTGAGMVLNELKPTQNQTAVVLGLGGIGFSALAALRATGVSLIIAADISDEKLDFAKKMGATYALNTKSSDFVKNVHSITGGGANICIESAGLVETIELGFSLIRNHGGRLLFASHPPSGELIKIAPHELISGKKISGSWGGACFPDRDIPSMSKLFMDKEIPLDALLTKRYRLDQVNDALKDLESGKVFRPLIVMEHPNELY